MGPGKLARVVSALFLAIVTSGCGGGGSGGGGTARDNTTSSGSSTANGSTSTAVTTGLTGTVADGIALANARVVVQSARGITLNVGTTDSEGRYSGFVFPDGFDFPAIINILRPDGKSSLRAIIPNLPGTSAITNINPITQAITAQVLPTASTLASLDTSTGDNGFEKKSNAIVQAALGTVVDYSIFANKPFQAKTTANPMAGGLADSLIDTIAGMDSSRKPEDLFASAADPNDPAVAKNLMSNPAFQARLAGELVSQGRETSAIRTFVASETASSGANTNTLLDMAEIYANSFKDVFTSANAELTDTTSQKKTAVESIVRSVATTVANIIEKRGITGGNSIANVVTNSVALVKDPTIAIGKKNQTDANLNLIIKSTNEQMATLISASTADLTSSGMTTSSLGNQVKNFGEVVSSAMANALGSGKNNSTLDNEKKSLLTKNISNGVAQSLAAYMGDLATDGSAMTAAQKASLAKAKNTANNVSITLSSALAALTSNENGNALNTEVLDAVAQALVNQSAQTFKNHDLTVDPSVFANTANKILTNMTKLAISNATTLSTKTSTLSPGRQAALTGAMAGQLLNEIKNLDLTGDTPPNAAQNVATNMAQVLGAALTTKVGQVSPYQGSNLQILAADTIANATTELQKTTPLTGVIDDTTLGTLQQGAAQSAETSRIAMEAAYKKFEDQGISLAEITSGLVGAGAEGKVANVILAQVQNTLASGGESLKSSARSMTTAAASMANAVLEKGGNLNQVQGAIAQPLAAMVEIAKGQAGQSSPQFHEIVRNSANTMDQAARAMAASKNMSLENMILSSSNVAAIVGTRLNANAADLLLNSVRNNITAGTELQLGNLAGQLAQTDPAILTKATAQQAAIQDQTTVLLKAVNKPLAINSPTLANPVIQQIWNGSGTKSFQVPGNTFFDADGDVLVYAATRGDGSALPPWLVFDPATRIFSGNPPAGATSLPIKLTVNDGKGGTAINTFTLATTGFTNDTPLTSLPLVDQTWSGSGTKSMAIPTTTFFDADGDTLTHTATKGDGTALPSWLVFNPTTKSFSGNPPGGMAPLPIKVMVDDGHGGTTSSTFNLTFDSSTNDTPVLANPIAYQTWSGSGVKSLHIIENTFIDADNSALTYSATKGDGTALPSWLVFDPNTRTLSGNPPNGQANLSLKVAVNDGQGGVANGTLELAFEGSTNDAPTLASPIANQTWGGSGQRTFQVPAGAFVDPDGDQLAYAATLAGGANLPVWLAFDPATRTFSGNPPANVIDLALVVSVTDGHGGATNGGFNLVFDSPTNDSPIVTAPIGNQTWSGNGVWFFPTPEGTFIDPDGDSLKYTATLADNSALPTWLIFTPTTKTFSGNPPVDAASLPLLVKATDGHGDSASSTFNLTFNGSTYDAPKVSSPITDQTWTGSGQKTFQIPAGTFAGDGDNLTYTATLENDAPLPSWLAFAPSTRSFSGNPPAGVTPLTIKVTVADSHGGSAKGTFNLAFGGTTNDAPVLANPLGDQTWKGTGAKSFQVPMTTFTDAEDDPLVFSATKGDGTPLPSWLLFDATTRTFSGNPPAGLPSLPLKVVADDGHGATVASTFNLVFGDQINDAPVLANPIANQTWTGSGVKSFQVPANTFTDADGDTLTYTAIRNDGTALPSWLTFEAMTGILSGNPPAGMITLAIKVTAIDGHGGASASTFNLAFSGVVNDAPTVANAISDRIWTGSGTKTFQVPVDTFSDADADSLTITATKADGTALPSWLVFDSGTRTFSGNPSLGTSALAIKVTANDGNGGKISSTFNLAFDATVNDAPAVSVPVADGAWTGNGTKSFQVPANTYADADGDSLTYTAEKADGSPLPSWLVFDPNTRTFSGNPPAGVPTLALKMVAKDTNNGTTPTTFLLNVVTANDTPTVADGTLTVDENATGTGTLVANDLENDTLTRTIVTNGSLGTATITNATTGAYLYIPKANTHGADVFTFKVNDGTDDSALASVHVKIYAVPAVSFSSSAQKVLDGHTAQVEIRLAQAAERDITLPYTLSGTAVEGVDYTKPTEGTPLTMTAGKTTKLLSLPILNNSDTEADNTVIITLGKPVNAQAGTLMTHTMTLISTLPVGGGEDAKK